MDGKEFLAIKLSGFADFFIFLIPVPLVSEMEDTLHNVIIIMTSFAIMFVVMCNHVNDIVVQNNLLCFKIIFNKKEIQIFVMNMTFISTCKAKKKYVSYLTT